MRSLVSTSCKENDQIPWTHIAKRMSGRTGKQCRERWHNHLKPDLKKGNWTEEEDRTIDTLQKKFGNQWSKISAQLPGRTDNDVKNRWHSSMRSLKRRATSKSHNGSTKKAQQAKNVITKARHTPIKSLDFMLESDFSLPLENVDHESNSINEISLFAAGNSDCNKENATAVTETALMDMSDYFAPPVASVERMTGSIRAAEIFSPSFFRRQLRSSWNSITPCSIPLATLPPCNSGPFMTNTPILGENYTNYQSVKLVTKLNSSVTTEDGETSPAFVHFAV